MKASIQIRQATSADQQIINQLLTEAAIWLKSKGSKQWNDYLEGKDTHHTIDAVKRNEVFVCQVDAVPAGMFILWSQKSIWDKELWANFQPEKNALYLLG